jgi:hypothetical protein
MTGMVRRLLLLVMAGLLIASCGDLPKPFSERAHFENNPLVELKDSPGIFIQPIGGMTEAASDVLRAAIKEKLFERNVPSGIDTGSTYQYRLIGAVAAEPEPKLMIRMQITWRLFDPAGRELDRFVQSVEAEHLSWVIHEQNLMNKIAEVVAGEIAPSVQDEEVEQARTVEEVVIFSDNVTGAPGTGDKDLTISMRAALRRIGFQLTETEAEAAYLVQGEVAVTPEGERSEKVSIRWHLVRTSDGELLGTVTQNNKIPAGALDGRWGAIAYDIAQGGIAGLGDLFRADGVTLPK